MDPRRKMDDRSDRMSGSVPFFETSRETILQPMSVGRPIERDILVIRVDLGALKTYSFLLTVVLATVVVAVIAS